MNHIDGIFRGLEQDYKRAVAKIYHRGLGREGWSGFVTLVGPCIIVTVSHAVIGLEHDQIYGPNSFYVKFFGDNEEYDARALACDFASDLLILWCLSMPQQPVFTFANPANDLLSSTTVMCISHPDQRNWIRLRGTICREPYRIGVHPYYDPNMLLFDHDVQLFPGSSGAPIIVMTGQVIGMQLTEACVMEHAVCIRDQNRLQNIAEYENADDIVCQVKELAFRPCNLKQAVTVQYISESLGRLFPEEDVAPGPGQDVNGYLRNLVTSFFWRQARRGLPRRQGSKQLQVPPPGTKPRRKTLLQSKMGCEERATMDFPSSIRSALGAGAAKGLASLHEECNPKILNRHVKAANILLNAKAFDPNSTSLCIHESAGALVSLSDAKKVYEGSPADKAKVIAGETVTAVKRCQKKMTIDSASAYARTLSKISGELSACFNKTPTPEILISVRGCDSDICKVVHAENLGVDDKKFCCSWVVDEISLTVTWSLGLDPKWGLHMKLLIVDF